MLDGPTTQHGSAACSKATGSRLAATCPASLSASATPAPAPPAVRRQQARQAGDGCGDPGAAVHQPGRADKGGHPHRLIPLPRQLSGPLRVGQAGATLGPHPTDRPARQVPFRLGTNQRAQWPALAGRAMPSSLFLFCEHPSRAVRSMLNASCTCFHNHKQRIHALCGHIGPVLLPLNVKKSRLVWGQCYECRTCGWSAVSSKVYTLPGACRVAGRLSGLRAGCLLSLTKRCAVLSLAGLGTAVRPPSPACPAPCPWGSCLAPAGRGQSPAVEGEEVGPWGAMAALQQRGLGHPLPVLGYPSPRSLASGALDASGCAVCSLTCPGTSPPGQPPPHTPRALACRCRSAFCACGSARLPMKSI